jgi:hypothetical protein
MSHHSADETANDVGHGSLEAARLFIDCLDVVREHAARSRGAADAPAIATVRLAADAGRQTDPPMA